MAKKIIQGSDANVVFRFLSASSGDPIDLTSFETIRFCFPDSNGDKFYKKRLIKTGNISIGLDIISNIDVTDIAEGDLIAGAGIPVGSTVIKTPTSATNPTAAGTIKISLAATATTVGVTLTVGDITIVGSPLLGKVNVPLSETLTDLLPTDTVDLEAKLVDDTTTSYVQFPSALNVIARYC